MRYTTWVGSLMAMLFVGGFLGTHSSGCAPAVSEPNVEQAVEKAHETVSESTQADAGGQETNAQEPVLDMGPEPTPQEPTQEPVGEERVEGIVEVDASVMPEPELIPEPTQESGPEVQPEIPSDRAWRDVKYANVSRKQSLHIFLPPTGNGPFPVVVWVHGGGWQSGSKNLAANAYQRSALTRGYALVSVGYRLSGEAIFPAQIHDVKTAIRFLRANGQHYALDTKKLGVWGASAGGHLVALLGTSAGVTALEGETLGYKGQSSRVQAVVDWFGPTNFLTMDTDAKTAGCARSNHSGPNSPESRMIGGQITQMQAAVKLASPLTHITKDDPPFFIQHGDKDCTVAYPQSEALRDGLKATGINVPVSMEILKGAGHSDPAFKTAANVKKVLDFFDKYIKP